MKKKMRINNPKLYELENGKIIKKLCPLCKVLQPIKNYHKNKSRPHGIAPYCKSCKKILYKKRWKKYCEVSRISIVRRRLQAFEIIANGKELKCVAHDTWNCCGDSLNALYLSLDHIVNDGYLQKKELKTTASTTIYNWVIKNPEEARKRLQILCMNAQTMKKRIYALEKKVVYFNGFGTLGYAKKTCHTCKGKGTILINQETGELHELKQSNTTA